MFHMLKQINGEYRRVPGTVLMNDQSNEIIYVPTQHYKDIVNQLSALENFVNYDQLSDLDPISKMAIIHHQFESIHPFPDGNGRIGRMINVLYLVKCGLLDTPILYLSRAIIKQKSEYYRLLQQVRVTGNWENWLLFMIQATAETAESTVTLIESIKSLMAEYKQTMRSQLPSVYSQEMLNNLFRHPYTRIQFVERDLSVSRPTATKRLEQLVELRLIDKVKSGRDIYYVNRRLVDLFVVA